MNFLHHSQIQKASAISLIVLLLFILTVKAFHTHQFSPSVKCSSTAATVLQAACPICDFQLAKDADVNFVTVAIQLPLIFTEVYQYTGLQQPVSFSITSAVRGPPSPEYNC